MGIVFVARVEDMMIRLAAAVATLALMSSIPAAGQTPKLSTQQLNSPTLNVNKPVPAPKAYSPNLSRTIVPKTPTIAVRRPVPEKTPQSIVSQGPSGTAGAQLDMINVQDLVSKRQQITQETPNILHKMNDSNCFQCIQNIK